MKTLFVVNFPPYPPSSGAPLRVWQHINVLATQGPVYVFSVGGEREPGEHSMPGVAGWIHFNDSDFSRSNGFIAKLARTLLPRQYIVPDTFARFRANKALKALLREIKPDIVVISHWKNDCPTPLRRLRNIIVDLHNIESLLGTGVTTVVRSPMLRALILWRWRRRERLLIRRARSVWVCGHNDIAALKKLGPHLPPPVIVPNAVDVQRYEAVRRRALPLPSGLEEERPTLIYVGLFSYHPNRVAAKELVQEIFPLVQQAIPTARLVLVGDKPTAEMKQAAQSDENIIVTGAVATLEPYLAAATACIVPLRTGGGTRLKILECFAANIAVISTAKGAEGLAIHDGREIRLAEQPQELADAAIELLLDTNARQKQVAAAFTVVENEYSWQALVQVVRGALSAAGLV